MFNFFHKKNQNYKELLIQELLLNSEDSNNLDKIYKKSKIDLNKLFIQKESALIVCCKKNLNNSALWLLNNKVDIEFQNSLGETALFYAIYSNDTSVLEKLLSKGVNVNHLNSKKRTALQESIFNSNKKISRFLLKKTDAIKNSDLLGNNVLFDAVNSENIILIEEILKLNKLDLEHRNREFNSILHLENALNNFKISSLLIKYGANPLLQNNSSLSFIFHIVKKGENAYKIIKQIEEKGHSLDSINSSGQNILMYAIEHFRKLKDEKEIESQRNLIKRIFQTNINKEHINSNAESLIFELARTGDKDLLNFAFENLEKQNLNRQNKFGFTPLFYLLSSGIKGFSSIELLLINGAKLDYKNRDELNSLEFLIDIILHIDNKRAIHESLEEIIDAKKEYKKLLEEILKNYTLDINELNSKNEPHFFSSLLNFNFSLFKILRTCNIDFNKKDKNRDNILFSILKKDISKDENHQEIVIKTVKNLLKVGINIDEKDANGHTLLAVSIINQKDEIIKLLVKKGASLDILDNQGRNLIHTTVFKNRAKYIKFLHHNNGNLINQTDYFGVTALNYALFMGKVELALKLILLGANIENNSPKSLKILEFLKKFHKNILAISSLQKDTKQKVLLNNLAQNMIVEFNIDISKR